MSIADRISIARRNRTARRITAELTARNALNASEQSRAGLAAVTAAIRAMEQEGTR